MLYKNKEGKMTPTPEIIALARRFHELDGTKGYLFNRHDFAIKPDGEVDCISFCDGENAYFRVYEDYPVSQLVPFLTESELWAWLKNITIDLEIYKYGGQLRAWYKGEKMSLVHFQYLHEALYRVAVWVAERKAK